MAAGVAVAQLVPPLSDPDLRWLVGAFLSATAALTALIGYTRWAATERAMCRGVPRPAQRGLVLVAAAMVVLALVVLALVLGTRP